MSDSPATPPLDALSLRLAAANALIRRRRSIKPQAMDQRPVDPRHLAAILENANWAPTHGMTEPWRFFVFTGAGRERLAAFSPARAAAALSGAYRAAAESRRKAT